MDRELWINNLRVENFPQVLYKEEAHLYFFVKGGILLFPDLASAFLFCFPILLFLVPYQSE